MKQKDYQKPTMRIVKLQHKSQILAGSVQAKRSGYDRKRSDGGTGSGEEIWDD